MFFYETNKFAIQIGAVLKSTFVCVCVRARARVCVCVDIRLISPRKAQTPGSNTVVNSPKV